MAASSQIGKYSATRSASHDDVNSVAPRPEPPALSPRTSRVKLTSGCSTRQASTSLLERGFAHRVGPQARPTAVSPTPTPTRGRSHGRHSPPDAGAWLLWRGRRRRRWCRTPRPTALKWCRPAGSEARFRHCRRGRRRRRACRMPVRGRRCTTRCRARHRSRPRRRRRLRSPHRRDGRCVVRATRPRTPDERARCRYTDQSRSTRR